MLSSRPVATALAGLALALTTWRLLVPTPTCAATSGAERLSIHAWSDSLSPVVFAPNEIQRSFAPDSIAPADRPELAIPFAPREPTVDGDLADWRFMRWNDLAGARAITRGAWSGPDDIGLRYSINWTTQGIAVAAQVRDDQAAESPAAVFFAFASDAPFVQRSWMGPSRRVRVRADGVVEAWTDLRGKRPEPFDATALGVQAAVRRDASGAGFTVECLVPWDALHPVLPHVEARLALNLGVEDSDPGSAEVKHATVVVRGQPPRPAWARCVWEGGPAAGSWLTSQATPTIEGTAEWSVLIWRATAARSPVRMVVETGGTRRRVRLDAVMPHAAAVVRVAFEAPTSVWPDARNVRLVLESPAGTPRAARSVRLAPTLEALSALRTSTAAKPATPGARFPSAADFVVRFDRAGRALIGLGTAFERRFHASGIAAYRAGAWRDVERWLDDAQALRDLDAEKRGAAVRRDSRSGVPLDSVVVRGLRSALDGSIQPYALYVPSAVRDRDLPLVVALHGHRGDEMELFRTTHLAAAAAARGWIVVCPFGRGDNGYEFAGERDVLEVLEAAQATLRVDPHRLYLTGHGMGGTGTWLLALRHPDLFAAAAPVSAYGDLEQPGLQQALGLQAEEAVVLAAHNPARLLRRGLTTACRIVHGERDPAVSVVHARIMAAKMTELGIPHELRLVPSEAHGLACFDSELDATLDFMAQHARVEPGRIDAARFAGSGGPVCDFFARGPFAIVYGTRGASQVDSLTNEPRRGPAVDHSVAEQLAIEWRARFAGDAVVLPDTAVTSQLLRTTNLILVGDAASNAWLARWNQTLPVQDRGTAFVLGAETLPWSQAGVFYAAVNPEHADRTVLVAAGIAGRLVAPRRSLLTLGADYVLLESGSMRAGHFAMRRDDER